MEKIPVGETIAHAYGFVFRDFLKLLGIVWAPLAVSIAVGLMMTPGFFSNHINLKDHEEMARLSLQMLPIGLLVLLPIRAMIAAGVTEQALGLRSGMTFVYFSIGPAIWRFLASWILVVVAMVILTIGVAIVFGIVLAVGGTAFGNALHGMNTQMVGGAALAVFLLLFYAAIVYLAVRLTFFIPPVVVAEKKVDLARVWQLSHGNFWRIFLIGFALFVPLIAVVIAEMFAIYGTGIFHFINLVALAARGAKQDVIQQQMQAWSETMRIQALAVWPYTAVFQLLFGTVAYGLSSGASAFAYRALVPVSGMSLPRD